ncbi:pectate lyase [Prochlorococcus sp. MIT 1307]|uniref:pectate lyase n=1 Tax=Prochlorococcus sp. MIT 1307 TaxID=3096219 RepID=UPI002A7602E2|nr:pectate lyase [Prochlorococcus sp. MIT 1307]
MSDLNILKNILVASLPRILNPFTSAPPEVVRTPWGNLETKVDIFPVIYLIFIYGFVYILPYGRDVIGISWFDWCRAEDGPLEWIQFIAFATAFVCSSLVLWKRRRSGINIKWFAWLAITLICFFVAGEEISWGERITGFGFNALRDINIQGESNLHNTAFFHHILLDPSFEISCILLGWVGWKVWPNIDAFPTKRYSLYFLFVALFYFYFDISYASTIKQIRNDQEIFELLFSIGLLSHCWRIAFNKGHERIRNK